ncbi:MULTISPECIES: DUF4124 domain-containing protein [Stutzerimonas stutzeri subgroup]|uniref:DUF4124 domain-containing protein n=2 Tax=Gammaproteobacteria TaxID=1236 RepID=A0A2N8RE89_STUST|nr:MULTISPECIES: DUF4124 domain-containing protein [Stutzerimonas stutzeri subgroup]KRW71841.1 hypothetical protein AO741_02755 [Pseudomonas sp. TTU2014-105ASC]MDH2241808.1 DUF4124 domain-containing protein [Pseudomonas sp. GD03909]MDH2245535.1 DUF4124 domain-containing protein [Pseudomonas sp. GD03856]MDH2264073.1 DUF4124 domain-containing protein [Pseudomonas sp. GD03855]MBA1238003.1 DUF4124 domain-containing protein [Stutzerimonas kunmingensis]
MLLLGVVYPALASAAELYRYVDERGVVVLDRHGVPPQHISRGYQVLNEQGRVIRVVPPAPSAEEFARLQAQKARDASDAQLLRLYASVEDVERAETRKLAELGSVIGLARGNLQSIRNQRSSLQKQAANHERAGRKVPDNLLAQIKNLEKEEQSLLRDLTRFEKARADAEVSFANDRQRVAELLGQTQ